MGWGGGVPRALVCGTSCLFEGVSSSSVSFLLFNRYEQRRSGSAGNGVCVKAGRAILGLQRSPRGNHCVASGSHSRTLKIYIALPPSFTIAQRVLAVHLVGGRNSWQRRVNNGEYYWAPEGSNVFPLHGFLSFICLDKCERVISTIHPEGF